MTAGLTVLNGGYVDLQITTADQGLVARSGIPTRHPVSGIPLPSLDPHATVRQLPLPDLDLYLSETVVTR